MYRMDGMNQDLDAAVKKLIEEIKRTDIYEQYLRQKEFIHTDADVKAKVDELRTINFQIQNAPGEMDVMEESERIEEKLEELCEDYQVNDFMQAELDFCRMFQDILTQIAQGIDFE